MIAAISGSSGLIGSYLKHGLEARGWDIIALNRNDFSDKSEALSLRLSGSDMVVNLAGAPIMHRWSSSYKETLYKSRIITTQKLVRAMLLSPVPPPLLISASAVGIYQEGGPHTESNAVYSSSFLGQLSRQWEEEALQYSENARVALLRFGVVLSAEGGALARLLPFFRLGLGGPVGKGLQPFPWIHITDILEIILFIQANPHLRGIFNCVAPEQLNNREFTNKLAKILDKPAFLTIPEFGLKLLFGEGASVLTRGQSVIPEHLINNCYQFRFQDLDSALKDLLS